MTHLLEESHRRQREAEGAEEQVRDTQRDDKGGGGVFPYRGALQQRQQCDQVTCLHWLVCKLVREERRRNQEEITHPERQPSQRHRR